MKLGTVHSIKSLISETIILSLYTFVVRFFKTDEKY